MTTGQSDSSRGAWICDSASGGNAACDHFQPGGFDHWPPCLPSPPGRSSAYCWPRLSYAAWLGAPPAVKWRLASSALYGGSAAKIRNIHFAGIHRGPIDRALSRFSEDMSPVLPACHNNPTLAASARHGRDGVLSVLFLFSAVLAHLSFFRHGD